MAAPIIRSSGSASGVVTGEGRNDLDIAETVTLTDAEAANTGHAYQWSMENRPPGSSATLTNPTTAAPTFVPDVTGSYRFSCTVDGVAYPLAAQVLSVPLPNSLARMPSFQERLQYTGGGNTQGWHTALIQFMRWVDANAAGGSSAYNTVHNPAGTPITQRTVLAFTAAFSVTDASSRTVVDLADAGVAHAKIANLAGLSLFGRGTNSSGVMAAITGTAGQVPKVNGAGTSLAFGLLANENLDAAAAIAHSKLADLAGLSVLARSASSSGAMAAVTGTASTVLKVNGGGTTLAFGLLANENIDSSAAIAISKLASLAGNSVLGRAAAGTGAMAAITASTTGHVLRYDGSDVGFGTLAAGAFAGTQTNTFVLTLSSGVPTWLAAAGGGGGYATIENPNGTPLTQRLIMAFSSEFTAADATDTTNIDLATNGVAFSKIAQLAAVSVLGVTGGSTANMAAITAGSDGHVLRRTSSSALAFGTLVAASFADSTITGARLTGFTDTTLPVANSSGQLTSSAITLASNALTHAASSSGGTVTAVVSNTSNTGSSHAVVAATVAGASGGNPRFDWNLTSGTSYSAFIDNANSDIWKLNRASVTRISVNGTGVGINCADAAHTLEVQHPSGGGTVYCRTVASLNSAADVTGFGFLNTGGATSIEIVARSHTATGTTFGIANAGLVTLMDIATINGNVSGMAVGLLKAAPLYFATDGAVRASFLSGGTMQVFGTTAPGSNPASGFYVWSDATSGDLMARGSNGTITTLAYK